MRRRRTSSFLPTNLREFITILEGLRISARPGRGLRHLAVRPTISPPLRVSEESLLTSERTGEFPILLEVDVGAASPKESEQASTIPITQVMRAIFRSEAERDVVLNRSFENASPDHLKLDVDRALFSGAGEARFHSAPSSSNDETASWIAADMIAGALAGALAAGETHPDAAGLLASFVEGLLEPVNLADFLDKDSDIRPASAAVAVIRSNYGNVGQDSLALLQQLAVGLSSTQVAPDVHAFRDHVSAVLASDQVRPRGSLSDDKNLLLRALSIVVQRSSLDDVLADRIEGELPGPKVLTAAAALAGLREGLAHIPASLKSPHRELLGRIAAVTEDNGPSLSTIAEIASAAGIVGDSETASEAESDAGTRQPLVLEVCEWSRRTIVKRALAEVPMLPGGWRVFIREDDTLCLQLPDAAEVDAAKAKIQQWAGRSRRVSPSHPKSRIQEADGMLPLLLSGEQDTPERE